MKNISNHSSGNRAIEGYFMGYRYVHQASVAVLSSSYRLCSGALKPLATSKIAYPNSGSGHNEVLPGEKDSVQGPRCERGSTERERFVSTHIVVIVDIVTLGEPTLSMGKEGQS